MSLAALPVARRPAFGRHSTRIRAHVANAENILSCTLQGNKGNRNISLWYGMPFVRADFKAYLDAAAKMCFRILGR
jgi:hypothetical protein